MFQVRIGLCGDARYHPLTVDGPAYLYTLARFISQSCPDAEVHAHLGAQAGDEVVFHAQSDTTSDCDVELF